MFELSIQKAFKRHERQMEKLTENENGVLSGGFSNFPKAKQGENPDPINAYI